MKVLVALSLIALAAAKPQFIHHPLVIPTIKTADTTQDTPVISTYTASYPYGGFPWVQGALPYNYRFPYNYSPFVTLANPAIATPAETTREKRSADPEPEADPALVYTTGFHPTGAAINYPTVATVPATIPTTAVNYKYTGLPAAVSTYTYPQTLRYTNLPYSGFSPIAGVSPYTGISPYASFPWFNPVVTAVKEGETEVARTKRSAEPEADPTLLTTGFTYPAVNTGTNFGTYYTHPFPTTYAAGIPSPYTAGFPFNYGTFPTATTGLVYG